MRRFGGVCGLALVLVLTATACGLVVQTSRLNQLRVAAGRPELTATAVPSAAATAHAQTMCDTGVVEPAPPGAYDQETVADVHELVGSAPLDPSITDLNTREAMAANGIWTSWAADPALVDARWDDMGIGQVTCADGDLYQVAVLRDLPSMPASGMFSTPQYASDTIVRTNGLQYGSAVNVQGVNQALLLDVYRPPGAAPAGGRPTILLFHGGGFVGGNRDYMQPEAVSFAQRGYVAVTVTYRLSTSALINAGGLFDAVADGIDDGLEAVRWLRANGATYGIANDKIAALGASAGGAITLGMAIVGDPTPGGPLAAFSSDIAAGVSTGAYLTPAIGTPFISFDPTDAPVMMLHYEVDSTTDATDEYAFETCAAVRAGGSTCDFVVNPGTGHTAWVQPGGTWWDPKVGPFLYTQLRLGAA